MQRNANRFAAGTGLVLGLMSALLASQAVADQPAPPQDNVLSRPARGDMSGTAAGLGPTFDALDTNGDAQLRRDEVAASPALAARFDDQDRDNDGTLTRAEYEDWVALESSTQNDDL